MISHLRIRNLATIEDIELRFKEGFSILTGETGVGKSIIIDGIRLALGEKGSPDIVRTGEEEVKVEAVFTLPRKEGKAAQPPLPEEICIQRHISREGTGKGYLNGVLVPLKKLRELGPYLVDIYGQNDHDFLLRLENHLNYLDFYAAALKEREEVAASCRELKKLLREKKRLEQKAREREQRLDFLRFQIGEIGKAELKPGEEESLHVERNILKNAEKIRLLLEEGLEISYQQENSVTALLSRLQKVVNQLSEYDPSLKDTAEALSQSAITIKELSDYLIRMSDKDMGEPEKLEKIEERLSLIENLKRKYGQSIPEILASLERAKKEYDELESSAEKLEELEECIQKSFENYLSKAETLSRLRREKARELEQNILQEIALLGMKKARFKIKIEKMPLSREETEKVKETGLEEVEFLISPNPGEELRPLRRIASGGELSRIMLALKSIGKEEEKHKTMVFDEIDAGIGGKTAEFVARKLTQLARRQQVICITHLPQIASFASHHFRISKKVDRERTFTTVKEIGFEERVTEIARLMSGTRITPTSLQNAREMLLHNLEKT